MKNNRPAGELLIKLAQQIKLLNTLCEAYDKDQVDGVIALSIATTLRVLLYDRKNSKSLLLLTDNKNIKFLDSSFAIDDAPGVYMGLVVKYFGTLIDGGGGPVRYEPISFSDFHKKFSQNVLRSFEDWWLQAVFRNPNGTTLSRKDLILKASNQEGGAHIDKKIDASYDNFRHRFSGGIEIRGSISGIIREFDNIPVYPAIRQIAFEVLESLKIISAEE